MATHPLSHACPHDSMGTISLQRLIHKPLTRTLAATPPSLPSHRGRRGRSLSRNNTWVHLGTTPDYTNDSRLDSPHARTRTRNSRPSRIDTRTTKCTPCWDVSREALLRPSQIRHYTYGNSQSDLDIQDCLEEMFKLLRLDSSIALMQQPEIDQMLVTGETPTRWSR